MIRIIQRWAQKDPEAAQEWVDFFPRGDLKNTAEEYIAIMLENE